MTDNDKNNEYLVDSENLPPERRPLANPYIKLLMDAFASGRLEEVYNEEKDKLENRLSFASAGDSWNNQVAASLRSDLQMLADAYSEVKLKAKSKKTDSAAIPLLIVLLIVLSSVLGYTTFTKSRMVSLQKKLIEYKEQELSRLNSRMQNEITGIKAQNEQKQGQIGEMETRISTLEQEKKDLSSEIERIKSENTRISSEKDALSAEISSLRQKKEAVEGKNTTLSAEKAALEKENALISSSAKKTSEELESLKRKSSEEGRQIVALTSENAVLKKEKSTLETEKNSQKKALTAAETRNKALEEEKKSLAADNDRLLKSNTQYFKELQELRRKCSGK